MSRRARLTILERGASATAWATCSALGADDWLVIAQQHDESMRDFAARVRQRARRLRKDANIESIDLYTAELAQPESRPGSHARRLTIVELGRRVAPGGRFTVWSGSNDAAGDRELSAILSLYGPLLAKRQVAMNHQTVEHEQRSGVRHAIPTRPMTPDEDFGALG